MSWWRMLVVYTIRPDKIDWENFKEDNINLRCAFKLPPSFEMISQESKDLGAIAVAINF